MDEIKISASGIDGELINIINFSKYGKEITEEIGKIANEVSNDALNELKSKSEQFNKYGTGKYAKSWAKKKTNFGYIIYNKIPNLPHLLENPHPIIARGKVVAQWKGVKHIQPVSDEFTKKYEDEVIKAIERGVKNL